MKQCKKTMERGVALITVILMVAITSALLVSLTDSTYISLRLNRAAEQRVAAEYVLKSAVNVAQVLIKIDNTTYDSPTEDAWMQFVDGRDVPGEFVGITEPNVKVSLLISSEKGKIPLLSLASSTGTSPAWRDILAALFKNLGFDSDPQLANQSTRGGGSERNYSSAEMVANLIDYLDADKNSYSDSAFSAQGMEGDLPPGEEFRNEQMIESLSSELSSIPGFSANRVQRLLPFVSSRSRDSVNVNSASAEVFEAIVQGLDSSASPGLGQKLVECRAPAYDGSYRSQISECIGTNTAQQIEKVLVIQSDLYYVIAKVEYGLSTFMATATLKANASGRLPTIEDFQVY